MSKQNTEKKANKKTGNIENYDKQRKIQTDNRKYRKQCKYKKDRNKPSK